MERASDQGPPTAPADQAGQQAGDGFPASITITIEKEGQGLLASAATSGPYDIPGIASRFYSFAPLPPRSMPPGQFWSVILSSVSAFLLPEPEE
jgi:hypothetical protein